MISSANSTTPHERLELFDVLRGFAMLGIFVVNLQSFAMPSAAYMNPSAFGSLEGLHGVLWALTYVFFDTKFVTIFSLLFGAGLLVASERAKAGDRSPWPRFLRRSFLILLIGLAHAYLLWSGDILFYYAICGVVAFLFKGLKVRGQVIFALLFMSVVPLIYMGAQSTLGMMPAEERAAMESDWAPSQEVLTAQVQAFQGSWTHQQEARVPETISMHTEAFGFYLFWRISGVMLLGMALYQSGVLTGKRTPSFYGRLALIALPLGLGIAGFGAWYNWSHGFAFETSMFKGSLFNYVGSLGVSLGYIGVIGWLVTKGAFKALRVRLAAIGRLALTCYLGQTLLATSLFYGHGFGLFAQVDRVGQWLLFIVVCALQLLLAPLWLKYFRQGPLEYLLRAGVYFQLPPIRQSARIRHGVDGGPIHHP
jgi:uncharacterized protein